jgi:tetratricopeptide (TPR) repeat protein
MRKVGYSLCLGTLLISCLVFTTIIYADTETAQEHCSRGVEYSKQGKFSEAIADLTKAIKIKPDFAEAYYGRGYAYFRQYKVHTALADCDKAIELKHDFNEAYALRGEVYSNLSSTIDEMKQAEINNKKDVTPPKEDNHIKDIDDFNKDIELNPNDVEAYYYRGLASGKQLRIDDAIADFTKAIELNPDFSMAYSSRSYAYLLKGKLEQAASDARNAMMLDPANNYGEDNLGLVYIKQGFLDKAITSFTYAIEVYPNDVFAYERRSDVYAKQGKSEQAEADRISAAGIKNHRTGKRLEDDNDLRSALEIIPKEKMELLFPDAKRY